MIDLEAIFTGLILGACLYVAGIITAQHVYRPQVERAQYAEAKARSKEAEWFQLAEDLVEANTIGYCARWEINELWGEEIFPAPARRER